jgi:hypothetical protein
MDDISEQIDMVLESSLEEFVRAGSLKGASKAKQYDPDAFLRGGQKKFGFLPTTWKSRATKSLARAGAGPLTRTDRLVAADVEVDVTPREQNPERLIPTPIPPNLERDGDKWKPKEGYMWAFPSSDPDFEDVDAEAYYAVEEIPEPEPSPEPEPEPASDIDDDTPLFDDDDLEWIFGTNDDDEDINENRKPADDLIEIVIDFEELKKQELNESFLAMFGGWVEQILGSIFTGRSLPLAVKGSSRDVKSFAKALGGEKDYIEAARQYGLDHPTTYKNKAKLNNAIKGFEKDTGLKWPFK